MNQVAVKDSFSLEEVDLIKKTIATGATDHELSLFMGQCKRTGLDPFTKQIYFMKISGKVTVMTSIDGLRLIAERSGQYDGQTTPVFCGIDGVWTETWFSKDKPMAAKVGVYKKGVSNPTYAIALWHEYGKTSGVWNQYPTVMLSKTAESLALRKAFPNDMSGLSSDAEFNPQDSQSQQNVSGIKDVMKEVGWTKPVELAKDPFEGVPSRTLAVPKPAKQVIKEQSEKAVNELVIEGSKSPGEYIVRIGKFTGQAIKDINPKELDSYLKWMNPNKSKQLDGLAAELFVSGEAWLHELEKNPPQLNLDEKID